jgi:hypothetical protein
VTRFILDFGERRRRYRSRDGSGVRSRTGQGQAPAGTTKGTDLTVDALTLVKVVASAKAESRCYLAAAFSLLPAETLTP